MAHRDLLKPRRTALNRKTLRRLGGVDTHGHRVLSLYVGFEPSQMPNLRERRMQADSLLAQAGRRWGADGQNAHADGQNAHADRIALREDIDAVRKLFADDRELAPESARGLAIFCAMRAGLYDVVGLREPVDPLVTVAMRPFIEPLLELASCERWCLLLISHRASRIFTGTRDHLSEVAHVLDEVHRHHEQGGWSQARYQRGIETETDWHLRQTCELLWQRFARRSFDRLLLGGPAELHHRVERELRPELSERLADCFKIDVERATPDEVLQRAMPLIEAQERRREQDALERLEEGLAPSGHGAVGLGEILEALNERRVASLLLAHGFAAGGFVCPSCGRLGVDPGACPVDAASPERQEDIVESAIELGRQQAADVVVVRHLQDRLAAHGSIGALLRF